MGLKPTAFALARLAVTISPNNKKRSVLCLSSVLLRTYVNIYGIFGVLLLALNLSKFHPFLPPLPPALQQSRLLEQGNGAPRAYVKVTRRHDAI